MLAGDRDCVAMPRPSGAAQPMSVASEVTAHGRWVLCSPARPPPQTGGSERLPRPHAVPRMWAAWGPLFHLTPSSPRSRWPCERWNRGSCPEGLSRGEAGRGVGPGLLTPGLRPWAHAPLLHGAPGPRRAGPAPPTAPRARWHGPRGLGTDLHLQKGLCVWARGPQQPLSFSKRPGNVSRRHRVQPPSTRCGGRGAAPDDVRRT